MTAEQWNASRVPAEGTEHVESYFARLNDPQGDRALWIKATVLIRRDGRRLAEAWAIAFQRGQRAVAVKDTTPLAEARFGSDGLACDVAGLSLRPGRITGTVGAGADRIRVDLNFSTESQPLLLFGDPAVYSARLPSSKLLTPYPSEHFEGTYQVRGETIEVAGWSGMQGHNWGSRHAERYAWGHVSAWDDADDLVLEAVTAQVRIGPVLTPRLSYLVVRTGDNEIAVNGFAAFTRTRARVSGFRSWRFSSATKAGRVVGEFTADPSDFAGLRYENPGGSITYCLNSKLAAARLRVERPGLATIEATTKRAAFEIGTKDSRHGVEVLL
jgi:hypothetical protein